MWNKTTYPFLVQALCIIPLKSIRMWASFTIFVDVDNYLIKNILVFVKIGNTEELQVIKWLMRNYGDSKEKEPLNWFGKKASVMAGYSDDLKTFYVHFCDLTQLKK